VSIRGIVRIGKRGDADENSKVFLWLKEAPKSPEGDLKAF